MATAKTQRPGANHLWNRPASREPLCLQPHSSPRPYLTHSLPPKSPRLRCLSSLRPPVRYWAPCNLDRSKISLTTAQQPLWPRLLDQRLLRHSVCHSTPSFLTLLTPLQRLKRLPRTNNLAALAM